MCVERENGEEETPFFECAVTGRRFHPLDILSPLWYDRCMNWGENGVLTHGFRYLILKNDGKTGVVLFFCPFMTSLRREPFLRESLGRSVLQSFPCRLTVRVCLSVFHGSAAARRMVSFLILKVAAGVGSAWP